MVKQERMVEFSGVLVEVSGVGIICRKEIEEWRLVESKYEIYLLYS
jgi:hypothetical protein